MPIFSATPPSPDQSPSALLLVQLTRVGTNVADTYQGDNPDNTAANNLGILSLDVHYQVMQLGTTNEFSN